MKSSEKDHSMRYELMLPQQIRAAIDGNWPVVLPLGVLEYHGEHLPVGLDTLVVVKLLEELEQEMEFVILPPFYYGAASYAVAGPERTGTLQVAANTLHPLAQEMFTGLLRIGFRNIHFFVHHQTENFSAGMPTDLAFKLGGRQAIFAFLEASRGEGWWGKGEMAEYYDQQSSGEDPFNWIKGHSLMTPEIIAQYPFDHAGLGETSLLMALSPEAVHMEYLSPDNWYTTGAQAATRKFGEKGRSMILAQMRKALS
jgi:creatinine amidohydrolase/Fe(II)-dependent formamide hydrolase-like protein